MRAIIFWSRLTEALRSDRRVLLAVVAESSVHSPGTAGAKMFVDETSVRVGTIGGGVMELRVLELARDWFDEQPERRAERVELCHQKRLGDEAEGPSVQTSGMICAGRQTNLYAQLRPEVDLAAVEAVVGELERGGGGGWWVDSSGRLGLAGDSHQPRSLRRDGDAWFFQESLLERRRLAILGGGHCGQALARLMAGIGWQVSVWETRPQVIADADLDGIAEVHQVDDFRDAADGIDLPELTPVVVMTTDVPNDVRALFGVLRGGRGFPLVGAMGSAAKIEEIRRRLADLGVTGDELAKMTAPVGLDIDSHTPPEIAVSVAAQLLGRRHEWLGEG